MLVVISVILLLIIYFLVPTITCFLNLNSILPDSVSSFLNLMSLQVCYGKAEFVAFLSIVGIFFGSFVAKYLAPIIGINFAKTIKLFIDNTLIYKKSNILELQKIGLRLFWLEYVYKFLKLLSRTVNFEALSNKHILNIFPNKIFVYIFSATPILQVSAFFIIFSLGMQISNILFSQNKSKIKIIFDLFIKNKINLILFILFFLSGSWERYQIVIVPLFIPFVFSYISSIKIYRPYFNWKQFYLFTKIIVPILIILSILNPWILFTRLNQSYTLSSMIDKKDEIYFKSSLDLMIRGDLKSLEANTEGNENGRELGVVIPGDDKTGHGVTLPGDIFISTFKYPLFLVFLIFSMIGFILVFFENYLLGSYNSYNLVIFSYMITKLPTGYQTQLWLFTKEIFLYLFLLFLFINFTRVRWR